MEKQGHRCRQVVLVPIPLQGHITPMLQLGTILHSRGFSITVAHAQFNSPHASNHPDFTFLPLSDGSSSTPKASDDFIDFMSNINLNCRAPLQEALTRMIAKQEDLPCVIHDGIMHCAEAVARHLKLPSIILYTLNPTNLLTYYAYPRLLEQGHIPFPDSKLLELVPGLDPLRFKDLPASSFGNLSTLLPFTAILRDIGSSSAIILNTSECLEQSSIVEFQEQYPVPIFSIGPMHLAAPASSCSLLKEDTSCIEWLDKQTQHSVIYVSFGSIALTGEKELAEMAWGLANSKQPFLWVLRPGSADGLDPTDLLPDSFKETVEKRGCIVNWAPQRQVLAHSAVGGFWTHCGWNSILESISEGVPMICRSAFGDQKVNARYVCRVWNVGFEFENDLERGEIERVITRLMVEKEGEEMRKRALDLKVKVELCSRKGGSSYNLLNELVDHIMSV
ncbi:UDP-glycosyltransferase 76E2 [Citrus sinensis]|uniref:UDP-glucose iridoid glucosyltransferase-like n=1 Tax=Citrus sinensis TaxID=2711 RepID=UPI0003D6EA6D|nr:UDP-glucose iridoid glucosyltransferase-like [Citrus sinensis]KAH9661690.1 UDP-glycosyltransferase 76E2 [Citrus sinensis]GAY37958.1 hypothetical protein CUMW_033000 [Citrus unshiu]